LNPPNGVPKACGLPLMLTMPVRMRRATASARSGSPLHTDPDSPYGESLAMATAASSPS
jgi:hypothetical protein